MSNLWTLTKYAPNTSLRMAGETIPELFWNAVAARGPQVWLRQKELGIWHSWSWNDAATAVREIGAGLMSIGFERGECAAILSNTLVRWVLTDLAILSCAGVCNGIYPTDAPSQVQYLCEDSGTVLLFVEDEEQLDKALEVRPQLPRLRKIIVFDMKGLRDLDDPGVMSLDKLREAGRAWLQQHPQGLEERIRASRPEDLAILVYTSGTTGKPKGAMQSHSGLVYSVRQVNIRLPSLEHDERMCFLPLCHIAERIIGEYSSVYTGCVLNFVENPDTIPENVREISPTFLFAVPRVWEKFYSGVVITIKEAAIESAVWVTIGLAFTFVMWFMFERAAAVEYISGYLIEKSLSVDNVFVWAMIFSHFKVPRQYQHRVLFWGIFGALVLRFIFIFLGVAIIERFDWILFVFGLFLIWTGVGVLRHGGEDETNPSDTVTMRLFHRFIPTTDQLDGQKLFTRIDGKRFATPLLAVLVVIEISDVIFAVDSVPAVLAVSHEQFIVFAANAFAIMGLRALYFLFADIRERFVYLKPAISVLLIYVGAKMLVAHWYHLPTIISLTFIVLVMTVAIVASVVKDRRTSLR